jgi:AraC-like DNA-binding protein
MTYPKTLDSSFFPILASSTPLVVASNSIHSHYPIHRHDVMEFSLVVGGHGTEWVNGIPHVMTPGTVTMIMPYQFHEIKNNGSEPLLLLNCMFGLELLHSAISAQEREIVSAIMPIDSLEPYVLHLTQTAYSTIESLFRNLLQEFNLDRKYRHTMLRAKLLEILVTLERYRSNDSKSHAAPRDIQHGFADKLLLYIHQNYQNHLTLKQLESHFYLSKTHICAIIRQTTGKSFIELQHEIRLRHACSLLVSSEMKLTDVAAESGFQSSKTFFRVFKKDKGLTPRDYRILHQGNR